MNNQNSWDPTWEKVFQSQEWGKYPPEELVRFIARSFYKVPDRKKIKVLDLGCGTGAATWFIAREGFTAYGIDGSETAIKIAKQRFQKEKLEGKFKIGDFIKLDYPNEFFDCVVDITALQHNKIENLKQVFSEISRVLKPNGKIFSMMVSKKTKFNEKTNPFNGRGYYHFFDKEEVLDLFSNFKNIEIEMSERTDRGNFISHYIVTGEKR